MKVFFIRLDKIGDLVASLPVDELPDLQKMDLQIEWIIAQGLGEIAKAATPKRSFRELAITPGLKNQFQSFFQLCRWIYQEKPGAIVIFQSPWWVSFAAWLMQIPNRTGRKSQWHSFVFLNRSLRQKRSLSEQHEADYNRDLVVEAFNLQSTPTPILKLQAPQTALLHQWDLAKNNYVVVHPGMAGSAQNWPQSYYSILIEKLTNQFDVVITGTKGDAHFLGDLLPQWKTHPRVRWAVSELNMPQLLEMLSDAKVVVGPSTGVLHLAASLGVPVIGLYSNVLAQKATRWGLRGPQAQVIEPAAGQDLGSITVNHVLGKFPK